MMIKFLLSLVLGFYSFAGYQSITEYQDLSTTQVNVYQFTKSGTTISTTSATFVTTGLTITIAQAGTYYVNAIANLSMDLSGGLTKQYSIALYRNGAAITNDTGTGGTDFSGLLNNNGNWDNISVQDVITFAAGDTITLYYRRDQGSATLNMGVRSIYVQRQNP